MEVLFVLILIALIVGIALAIYEWRKKRVLLAHDFNLTRPEDAHTLAARVHAEDVTHHRRSDFDR